MRLLCASDRSALSLPTGKCHITNKGEALKLSVGSARLTLAAVVAGLVFVPMISGTAHADTQDPNEVVTVTQTFTAKYDSRDYAGKDDNNLYQNVEKGGLAHSYPQYIDPARILESLKCGDKFTTQTDKLTGPRSVIESILADGKLDNGEDKNVNKGWKVQIHAKQCDANPPVQEFKPFVDLVIWKMPNSAASSYESWFDQSLRQRLSGVDWSVDPNKYKPTDECAKFQWDKYMFMSQAAVDKFNSFANDGILTAIEDRQIQKMSQDGLIKTVGGHWLNNDGCEPVVPPVVDPEPVDPPVVVDPTPVEPETPVTDPEPEPEPPIVDDTLPVPPPPPVRPTPDKPNPAPQPVKPAPKPTKPVVKYVTKTFQVDSYRARNAAQARLLASLDNDGVLKFREDGKLWNPRSAYVSYWQFVTVKVPANATKAQLIKAINAKTNKSVGDVRTTSKLASAKVGKRYTVAWELGRGAKPTTQLAWGANKKVNQIFLARS